MTIEQMRERAEWAIAYGSHSSDVSEANEECEQFGRDVLAIIEQAQTLRLQLARAHEALGGLLAEVQPAIDDHDLHAAIELARAALREKAQ